MTVVEIATVKHVCQPPLNRPKDEWRRIPPPLGFMKPEDRAKAKPVPIPTSYPPGTVWLCECGRGWIARMGSHYGGHSSVRFGSDAWAPVPWWHFKVRRAIKAHKAQADYQKAAEIVAAWKPSA